MASNKFTLIFKYLPLYKLTKKAKLRQMKKINAFIIAGGRDKKTVYF